MLESSVEPDPLARHSSGSWAELTGMTDVYETARAAGTGQHPCGVVVGVGSAVGDLVEVGVARRGSGDANGSAGPAGRADPFRMLSARRPQQRSRVTAARTGNELIVRPTKSSLNTHDDEHASGGATGVTATRNDPSASTIRRATCLRQPVVLSQRRAGHLGDVRRPSSRLIASRGNGNRASPRSR